MRASDKVLNFWPLNFLFEITFKNFPRINLTKYIQLEARSDQLTLVPGAFSQAVYFSNRGLRLKPKD